MQGVRTRETRPNSDHGHQQQPVLHSPGRIPPPGVPRRDKSQMADDLRLRLDARDRSGKLYRHAKKKERHRNIRADPTPQDTTYQPPKPSTFDEVLRGPSLVTEQAMAHFLLQNMRQNQPMMPPPTVRFQDLTEPSSPPLTRQWKFGERNSTRRQRQEAIIHPSPREEEVRLSPNASN